MQESTVFPNMKLLVRAAAVLFLTLPSIALAADSPTTQPTLSAAEKSDGWKLLFDGVSTTGWRGLGMDGVPATWVVQDGCLHCLGGAKGANDLVTADKYENFELSFEWMI